MKKFRKNLSFGAGFKLSWSYLLIHTFICTYIMGHIQWGLFSQDYDLASYTTYVVCLKFIREWQDRTHRLMSIPNDRFFKTIFMAILFTLTNGSYNLLRLRLRFLRNSSEDKIKLPWKFRKNLSFGTDLPTHAHIYE